jgi:NADPH:quinone reductase-like Zn-dependent oxidoreductase
VREAGVGNWDEFVRTGGWDVGAKPPMVLGVEAAGTVLAAGQAVGDWAPGDAIMTCRCSRPAALLRVQS